jgi:hypothetical protein
MHTRQLLLNLCLVIAGGFVSFVDIQPRKHEVFLLELFVSSWLYVST